MPSGGCGRRIRTGGMSTSGSGPTRAAAWLLSLVLVGTVTFALRRPPALKPEESPEFNALAYT